MVGVTCTNADIGFDFAQSANVNNDSFNADTCTTLGVKYNHVPFCTLNNWGCFSGGGVSLTRVTNTSIGISSIQDITGVGLQMTDCYNLGMLNYAIIQTSSHGIELVSGNHDMDLGSGYIDNTGGDGIKFTANDDSITLNTTSILNSTGYQINIANANCNDNILVGIKTDGSGSGSINDIGTGTLKSTTVNIL